MNWNLQLHINLPKQGFVLVESAEPYSELHQWEKIGEWKIKHELDNLSRDHFFCLTRISNGVNNYNES